MREFLQLLRQNHNYRYTWMGQVVSEIGDHFNNIAVFALALALTHSGLVVTGIMLSRALPAVTVGPLAGVVLDRFDCRAALKGRTIPVRCKFRVLKDRKTHFELHLNPGRIVLNNRTSLYLKTG